MKLVPPPTPPPDPTPPPEPLGVDDEEHAAELLAIVDSDIFAAQIKRRERRGKR